MNAAGTDTKIYATFILNTPNTVNDIKSKAPCFKMQLKQSMLKAQLMESLSWAPDMEFSLCLQSTSI